VRRFPRTLSEISTTQYPWPKRGDRLFRPSGDWHIAATFAQDQLSRDAFLWGGCMSGGHDGKLGHVKLNKPDHGLLALCPRPNPSARPGQLRTRIFMAWRLL
jgi:hypothetical protein